MYTPRPKRLLVDGDVYKMDFERDEAAYEDYQELLGRTAGRNVNTKYNEYVDKKWQWRWNVQTHLRYRMRNRKLQN